MQEFRAIETNVIFSELKWKEVVHLLVALLKNGQRISLVEGWTKAQLVKLRKNESFFCPACQQEVILKLGNQRTPHFAHKKEGTCALEQEAESQYHAAGKIDFFHWLQKQSISAQLELYFHQIQQRPDLSIIEQGKVYALEYQCSTISETLFCKRNGRYKKAGIRPIWVLGAQHLQQLSPYRFKLSRFHWLFAQNISPISPQPLIFYYCPRTKRLIRLTRFISFSSYYTFSVPVIEKLSDIQFSDFLSYPSVALPPVFWSEWLEQKKIWRLTFPLYRGKINRAICADFYPRCPPALFPPEAGWPLQHSYLFATPPFIWQTYILLFLEKRGICSLSSIYNCIKEKMKEKKITVRYLPLARTYHYTRAVYEYVQLLEHLGYVRWVNRQTIAYVKKWTFPKTIEEALLKDCCLLERVERKQL